MKTKAIAPVSIEVVCHHVEHIHVPEIEMIYLVVSFRCINGVGKVRRNMAIEVVIRDK